MSDNAETRQLFKSVLDRIDVTKVECDKAFHSAFPLHLWRTMFFELHKDAHNGYDEADTTESSAPRAES